MKSLIAKLEAATGPDRIMDAEIHRAITGMTYLVTATTPPVFEDRSLPPLYTSSTDAARNLIPDDCTFGVGDCGEYGRPWACVTRGISDFRCRDAATPELALCIAALRSRDGGSK